MQLTDYQKQIMRHTVSGHDRNWFGTSLNCKDSIEFQVLVKTNLATSETPPSWMGDEVIYRLTNEGKKALEGD